MARPSDDFYGIRLIDGPYYNAEAAVADTDFSKVTTALYWGGAAATITVVMAGKDTPTVAFTGVQPGTVLPIRIHRVVSVSAGTLADALGLW